MCVARTLIDLPTFAGVNNQQHRETMKKQLPILAAIMSVIFAFALGCRQKSTKDTMRDSFEEALIKAEHSQETETELFLGFRLGMSEDELNLFLDSLEHSGKVFIDRSGEYKYNFNISSNLSIEIGFHPMFENNSLYAVAYLLSGEYNLGNEMEMMLLAFNESERGKTFRGYYLEDDSGETTYHYIKDNLMVSFIKNGLSSYIKYENVPISRRIKRAKENQDEEARKQSEAEF